MKISAVIPVYNSADIVGRTIDRTVTFFRGRDWEYEIILVNDGSSDRSWEVLREKAEEHEGLVCIQLLRNYGQHSAVFCGLHYATGDWVVTLDDDLQNPPEEIQHLIDKAESGQHDVVFGQFRSKAHAAYRRMGSRLVSRMLESVFGKPKELVVSNFRLMRRDVVERMRSFRTSYPYITGLALMFSGSAANAEVEHKERAGGTSNYRAPQIARLLMRILFNYSSWPLRLVAGFGFVVAVAAFVLGGLYLVRALWIQPSKVPGWTTLVVLLSFFNGVTLMVTGMLGEYVIRLLNQSSHAPSYHISTVVRSHHG